MSPHDDECVFVPHGQAGLVMRSGRFPWPPAPRARTAGGRACTAVGCVRRTDHTIVPAPASARVEWTSSACQNEQAGRASQPALAGNHFAKLGHIVAWEPARSSRSWRTANAARLPDCALAARHAVESQLCMCARARLIWVGLEGAQIGSTTSGPGRPRSSPGCPAASRVPLSAPCGRCAPALVACCTPP